MNMREPKTRGPQKKLLKYKEGRGNRRIIPKKYEGKKYIPREVLADIKNKD